jgi:Type III flagellar switch regulator (C-ring) FliN C-term
LLLGAGELEALGAGCGIVSETGWRVSAATVVTDTPTFVAVEAAACAPQPLAMETSQRGVVLVPIIGTHRATVEQIATWKNPQRIDFQKPAALPLSLFAGGVELARGELVRVENELGIRLGAIYRKELP